MKKADKKPAKHTATPKTPKRAKPTEATEAPRARSKTPKPAPEDRAKKPRGRKPAKVAEVTEAPAQETPAAPTSTSPLDAPAPVEAPKAEAPRAPTPVREPIPGSRLALALRYAINPTPERDGSVVFDATREGWPFVHGHGMKAAHKAFLPVKSDCALTLCAVERDVAERLVKLLGSLRGATVRIDATGHCAIKHAAGQPELHYELDPRPFYQDYEPPVDRDATLSYVPLRIDGSMHARATRWPESVVEMRQTRGGVEWITLTAREGGELLAQAVLAEDGHDLYPEDERQTTIPGSLAVKAVSDRDRELDDLFKTHDAYIDRAVARAVQAVPAPLPPRPAPPAPERPPFPSLRDDGRASLRIDRQTWQSIPGPIAGALAELPWVVVREDGPYVVLAAMNVAEVAAVAELLASAGLRCSDVMAGPDAEMWFVAGPPPAGDAAAQPDEPAADAAPAPTPQPQVPASDAFPTPTDDVKVVLGLTAAAWARLDERTREMLASLDFLSLADVGDGERASAPLAPAEVAAVVAILAADGLRCVDVTHSDPGDEERCEEWTVDVAPAPGELAPFPTPGERPVVFEVPEAVWAGLSSVQVRALDVLAAQETPPDTEAWYRLAGSWRTSLLSGAVAARIGRKLASWGLRCEERSDQITSGVAAERWRVGRVGEKGGAAL